MPIYEYRCGECEVSFEALVRPHHDDDAECPQCGGRKLTREMSTFAARSNGNGDGVGEVLRGMSARGMSGPSGGCCGTGGCGCH